MDKNISLKINFVFLAILLVNIEIGQGNIEQNVNNETDTETILLENHTKASRIEENIKKNTSGHLEALIMKQQRLKHLITSISNQIKLENLIDSNEDHPFQIIENDKTLPESPHNSDASMILQQNGKRDSNVILQALIMKRKKIDNLISRIHDRINSANMKRNIVNQLDSNRHEAQIVSNSDWK